MQELQANAIVEQFLGGVTYPISRPKLLATAREAKIEHAIMEALEEIPDRDYESKEDVARALHPDR